MTKWDVSKFSNLISLKIWEKIKHNPYAWDKLLTSIV